MKVFEVNKIEGCLTAIGQGIYASKEKAILAAQKLAVEEGFARISDTEWGEKDDWGMVQGIVISAIEVIE